MPTRPSPPGPRPRARRVGRAPLAAGGAFVLGLAAGPALGAGTTAQMAAPANETGVSSSDEDARVEQRLLHAQRGGVLRATSRWREGRWEYKDGTGWHALPPGMITRARPLDEALSEWGKRRASAHRDDLPARVAVAAWGFDEGLYEESLRLLDDVLEEDPDQPDAVALLHRDDLPIAIPSPHAAADALGEDPAAAARLRLIDFAASTPPALREMAVARMGELAGEEAAALRATLDACLLDEHAARRAAAALALRRLASAGAPLAETELQELLRRAVRDVDPSTRRQAALALGEADEPALMLPVLRAMESESAALRTHAAEALGLMGHPEAVGPLVERLVTLPATGGSGDFHAPRAHVFVGRQIAFVQDFDVDVAQNAAIGDPQIGTLQEGVTLDVRVLGASSSSGYGYAREAGALRASLERLTGVRAGSTKTAWKAWWEAHREQWPRLAGEAAAGG